MTGIHKIYAKWCNSLDTDPVEQHIPLAPDFKFPIKDTRVLRVELTTSATPDQDAAIKYVVICNVGGGCNTCGELPAILEASKKYTVKCTYKSFIDSNVGDRIYVHSDNVDTNLDDLTSTFAKVEAFTD